MKVKVGDKVKVLAGKDKGYFAVSIGIAYTLNYWRLSVIYGYEIVAIFVVIFGFRLLQKYERVQ